MNVLSDLLGAVFTQVLTQSALAALVFLVVLPLSFVFRRSPAWVHIVVWSLVPIRLLMPADFGHPLSLANFLRTEIADARPQTTTAHTKGIGQPAYGFAEIGVEKVASVNPIQPLAVAWAIGFLSCLLKWERRRAPFRRAIAESTPAANQNLLRHSQEWRRRLRVHRPVRLLITSHRLAPFTAGLVRPVIVLPRVIAERESLARIVVAHEMGHVARGDSLWLAVQQILCAIHFFNPLIWLATARLSEATERACDDLVLARGVVSPRSYASGLVDVLALGFAEGGSVPAMAGSKRRLTMRITEILHYQDRVPSRPLTAVAAVIIMTIFVLPMAAVAPSPVPIAEVQIEASSPATPNVLDMANPLPNARLSMGWGNHRHPFKDGMFHHNGLDLAAPLGTPIAAPSAGTVDTILIEYGKRNTGRYVILDHGNGLSTFYSHLNDILVKKGQRVARGETIATVGNTGLSTGPHLHFEVRENGESIDPSDRIGVQK